MATDKRYKTFTYKRASCASGPLTLQQKLTGALNARKAHASDRCQALDEGGNNMRGVDEIITHGSMLFGTMVDFNRGSHQPIIGADLSQPSLSISLLPPPAKKEFLEKYLFFGVKDNHVILVQSTIRAKHLEAYCNWLLQLSAPSNGTYHPTYLVDLPPEQFKDTSIKSVKSIQLSQPIEINNGQTLATRPSAPVAKKTVRSKAKEEVVPVQVTGLFLDLIRQFAPKKEKLLSSMSFEDAVKAGRVRATVLLEVQGRMDTDEAVVPFMDEFAHALRDVDEDDLDYTIHLSDGQDIKAGTIKLKDDFLISCPDGMPRADEIRTQMTTWLASSIESGRVY
jgi:hypothetical protein